jgi:DNA-directed RNA polymerase specialized sigma24 family protein
MNEFGRLLEKEIPRLRRYVFALTRNMSRADDLVQDALVRAIAKQRYLQWGTNLRAWLFTIMHRQSADAVRRSVREGSAVAADDAWSFPTAATDPTAALSFARSRPRFRPNFRGAAPGDSPDRSRRDFV